MRKTLEGAADFPADRPAHPPTIQARGRQSRWFKHRYTGVLAGIVLFAIGILVYDQLPVVVTAPHGSFEIVQLPDGSTVQLNSGSTLRYDRIFGKERAIRLEGEAYFDVSPDSSLFTITTFDARIEVFGTTFNVKAWEHSLQPHTSVALVAGRVSLASRRQPGAPIFIAPGEIWEVNENALVRLTPPDTVAVRISTAWRNGSLYFRNAPVGVVLEELERRFDVDLEVADADLYPVVITLSMKSPVRIDGVLDNLCAGLGAHYRQTARGFEIYRE
jgi:ferric-dicitrate binding protein FerR (iron transport regulator)